MPFFQTARSFGQFMAIWSKLVMYIYKNHHRMLPGNRIEFETVNVNAVLKIVLWGDWCWRHCYTVGLEKNDQIFL